MRLLICLLFLLTASLPGCTSARVDDKISVAILTGQNNHAWFKDTPVLKQVLDDAVIFDTTLLITPDQKDPDKAEKWKAFSPDFTRYDVVILNYNGQMWPARIKQAFEVYIAEGGKAMSFHAGNNPFRGWTEFEKMIGLLWRKNSEGKRVYFDDAGNKHVMPPGEGPGAGHGRQHPFLVDTRDNEHPVFKGLPDQWMHAKDELYHGQRGPAENMTVLMTAYADPATNGSGVHEPVIWTIPYGEGTVMTNVLGHWWRRGKGGESLQCAGFQTVFTRSTEWLATGKVTIPMPDDFPTRDKVSMRELKPFEPLAYIYVPGVPGSDPLASCGCSPQTQPGFVSAWVQYAEMLRPVPGEATAGPR